MWLSPRSPPSLSMSVTILPALLFIRPKIYSSGHLQATSCRPICFIRPICGTGDCGFNFRVHHSCYQSYSAGGAGAWYYCRATTCDHSLILQHCRSCTGLPRLPGRPAVFRCRQRNRKHPRTARKGRQYTCPEYATRCPERISNRGRGYPGRSCPYGPSTQCATSSKNSYTVRRVFADDVTVSLSVSKLSTDCC